MIDFELSEELRVLQKSVREFAATEVAPHCKTWNEEERFPHELIPKLGELGLLGMSVPERYGGAEMGMQAISVVVEELAVLGARWWCGDGLPGVEGEGQLHDPGPRTAKSLGWWAWPGRGGSARSAVSPRTSCSWRARA